MIWARQLAEVSHALRKQAEIKVRIPIKSMTYMGPSEISTLVLNILKDEVNVYDLKFTSKADVYSVVAKTSDDNLDLQFGLARDIVRKIQEERKAMGTKANEKVNITIPFWPKEHEVYMKRKALIANITEGEKFSVSRDE